MIEVYAFDDAPPEIRAACNQGGDEDWIVVVPATTYQSWGGWLPPWLQHTDTCRDPKQILRDDGTVIFVGCHA